MLVLSDRAADTNPVSAPLSQLVQLMDRRLSIARLGLAEASRHLAEGRAEDAEIVLGKIDEDLELLRSRLQRESAASPPRRTLYGRGRTVSHTN